MSCRPRRDSGSPHTRGWTLERPRRPRARPGFPAHAGMDPRDPRRDIARPRVPRTRGDGPFSYYGIRTVGRGSPHTRGWTAGAGWRREPGVGFPAHAGMDRVGERGLRGAGRVPRTRGDGPGATGLVGCRTGGSPHTRGWTPRRRSTTSTGAGFPAHAGMDPARRSSCRRRSWVPRTRGDGPEIQQENQVKYQGSPHTRGWTPADGVRDRGHQGFPAHAGMDPTRPHSPPPLPGVPRTRGDGPYGVAGDKRQVAGSPHTRGWTRGASWPGSATGGFPAHAGMDPMGPVCGSFCMRVPRTRGDGPGVCIYCGDLMGGSPHTRGWTRATDWSAAVSAGFPAHAGMDRPPPSSRSVPARVPRTRGDGPPSSVSARCSVSGSPHTRGWTRLP